MSAHYYSLKLLHLSWHSPENAFPDVIHLLLITKKANFHVHGSLTVVVHEKYY